MLQIIYVRRKRHSGNWEVTFPDAFLYLDALELSDQLYADTMALQNLSIVVDDRDRWLERVRDDDDDDDNKYIMRHIQR